MKRYPLTYAILLALAVIKLYAALPSDTTWEVRAACMSSLYGGMYSSSTAAGGGLDYSQQDNPQLTVTDAASLAGSTTLTSATGGFTAQMDGNGLHLSGGSNFTAGWYMITAHTDTNTVTLDRSPAPSLNGTGGTVKVGGAAPFTDACFEAAVAGNTVYVAADATHTLAASVSKSTNPGTVADPINIIGYNGTRGAAVTGTNRPLIAGGASYTVSFASDTYTQIRGLRFSSSAASAAFVSGSESLMRNIYSTNTSAGAGTAVTLTVRTIAIDCEMTGSATSTGLNMGADAKAIGCYIHDLSTGITTGGSTEVVIGCVIDTCTTGFVTTGADYFVLAGNTFYSGTTAISFAAGTTGTGIFNNIISSYTTGITAVDDSDGGVVEDYNNIYNCTTDRTNVPTGANSYDLDPGFVDAAGGDFRVGTNCKAKGFPGAIPGAAATCIGYLDTGAVQRIESTGGGTRATGGIW